MRVRELVTLIVFLWVTALVVAVYFADQHAGCDPTVAHCIGDTK